MKAVIYVDVLVVGHAQSLFDESVPSVTRLAAPGLQMYSQSPDEMRIEPINVFVYNMYTNSTTERRDISRVVLLLSPALYYVHEDMATGRGLSVRAFGALYTDADTFELRIHGYEDKLLPVTNAFGIYQLEHTKDFKQNYYNTILREVYKRL